MVDVAVNKQYIPQLHARRSQVVVTGRPAWLKGKGVRGVVNCASSRNERGDWSVVREAGGASVTPPRACVRVCVRATTNLGTHS